MKKIDNQLFSYFVFDNLSKYPDIAHFVSSGEGGAISNINLRCEEAVDNRCRLARAVGFDIERLTTGEQTHSLNVAIVTAENAGMGALDIDSRIPNTDALITNQRGICLMVLTADCAPVLLYDTKNQVIAAIHAGWRGTVDGIVSYALKCMQQTFGTCPHDVKAAIGPCIAKCCFEVGKMVWEVFPTDFVMPINNEKAYVDLQAFNARQLQQAGVSEENIELANICTRCDTRFFSFRRDKISLGRMGTGIMLK